MRIKDGAFEVLPDDLIPMMNDEQLRYVGEKICFDELAIKMICDLLVKGDYFDDAGHAWWQLTSGKVKFLEKARLALMPLLSEIHNKIVTDLLSDRDKYYDQKEQWMRRCWDLEKRWREGELPPSSINYVRRPWTREDVRAFIERAMLEIEGMPSDTKT